MATKDLMTNIESSFKMYDGSGKRHWVGVTCGLDEIRIVRDGQQCVVRVGTNGKLEVTVVGNVSVYSPDLPSVPAEPPPPLCSGELKV